MPVPAVPEYIPREACASSSPALRWGAYLAVWMAADDQVRELEERAGEHGNEFVKSKGDLSKIQTLIRQHGKEGAVNELVSKGEIEERWARADWFKQRFWAQICRWHTYEREVCEALRSRQNATLCSHRPESRWESEATTISPFTTGLGNEHPLENGFSFLNPYGLPYLPGSGVKGVVREAARQLSEGEWEDSRGWDKEPAGSFTVRVDGEEKTIGLTALDVLFGRETPEGESEHFRGVLSFWDVIPQIPGDQLRVEVMTPHQSHYYQQKEERKSGDSTSPHDSGQPNPILFLTVPPGAKFRFVVTCDVPRLKRIAPGLAEEDRWKKLLDGAFGHAFDWLGFGAKTAVGYGAMRRAGASRQETGSGKASSAAGSAPAKPAAASQTREEIWENATLTWRKGSQELAATAPNRPKAILRQQDALRFLDKLPASTRELLEKKSLSPFRVRVRVEGNMATILDPA